MDRKNAEKLLAEAKEMNEGAWINGSMQARHAIEGFQFLTDIGFDEGARI